MDSFKSFVEDSIFIETVLNEFNGSSIAPSHNAAQQKPWSAKKPEILQMWRNLRPDVPIIIQPVADNAITATNSSYSEDGIRITGSWQFISSVLARIKEILGYENQQTKLRLVFRGIDKKNARPDRQSFAFYVNLENRARKKPKLPTTTQTPIKPI